MNRAARDLANFSDSRLFKEVSEGIPLIAGNAAGLDETANRLFQDEEFRASEILRGLAEEEAAKVLILIDLVRCSRSWSRRAEVAKRFYGHVAKRIYAMACSYPNIWTFKEISDLVQIESRPFYLDGPNWVDWIFPNSIIAEREQALYVDYVKNDIDPEIEYYWRGPPNEPPLPAEHWRRYESPHSVTLSKALSEVGANSCAGLAAMADVWRDFKPEPETTRDELRERIEDTLDELKKHDGECEVPSTRSLILSFWSFPLWQLEIEEPRLAGTVAKNEVRRLREERDRIIQWIEETEAKRDPPPAISGTKVKALSEAYAEWMRDVDAVAACDDGFGKNGRRSTVGGIKDFRPARSPTAIAEEYDLHSYARFKAMFQELTEEERAALLALGWFVRYRVADWPRVYNQAKDQVSMTDERYEISLGNNWLTGWKRWKNSPQRFETGRWYRTR